MKRLILIMLLLLLPAALMAQVRRVQVDLYGQFVVEVELPNRGYVVMDQYGNILQMNAPGMRVKYYSGYRDSEAGKLQEIGGVKFKYHGDFWGYEAGKIERIGNVRFEYYSDFNDYEAGKIRYIGSTRFSYNSNFYRYEAGKIDRIGSNRYDYHTSGRRAGELRSGIMNFRSNGIEYIVTDRLQGGSYPAVRPNTQPYPTQRPVVRPNHSR